MKKQPLKGKPIKGRPTEREKDVLAAIRLYQKAYKRPPTHEEIGAGLGISKSAAGTHCRSLRDKGLVTWDKWKSRTLRIL